MADRVHPGTEASEGDLQEQQRDPIEDRFDPEQPAEMSAPDGSSVEADPADVQEQSVQVQEL